MDKKISALSSYSAPISTDVLPIVDVTAGETKKIQITTLVSIPASKIIAPSSSSVYADYYTDGTADQVQINAAIDALTSGGKVYLKKGTYTISAPIIIKSNIYLDATEATIVLAAASNCNMLVDADHDSGAGAISNVTVDGGVWNRQNNSGSGNDLHSIILGGTNIEIKNLSITSTAGKYSILIQNATNFKVKNIFCNTVASDGVHVQGPAVRGVINDIYGTSSDDLVAITPYDYAAYVWGNEGDVTDIVIENIYPHNCATNAVKVLSGKSGSTVLNTSRIIIRNVVGSLASGFVSGIYLGDDTGSTGTQNGQISDVLIDGIKLSLPNSNTKGYVTVNGSATSLTIPSIVIRNIHLTSDCSAIVSSTGDIRSLLMDGVQGTTATAAMTAVVWNNQTVPSASLLRLQMSNIDITFAGTRGGSLIRSSDASSTLTEVFLNNIYLYNSSWLADVITSTTFNISNTHMASNGGIFNVRSPGVVVVAGCIGSTFDTTSSTITSTGTLESKSYGFPIDVGNAQLVKNTGNMAYNTNAARSCGVGPVGYNGTSWYNAASGLTF